MNMPTISVVLLTYNRSEILAKTVHSNLGNADYKWDELIWVDNGSDVADKWHMMQHMRMHRNITECFFKENTGCPRGFNTAFSLSRSDWIVILGPDVIMPDQWLNTFITYIQKIPNCPIFSAYTVPIEKVPERYMGLREVQIINGLPVQRALPIEIVCFKRELLQSIGYFREDFSKYGWCDVEWGHRAATYLDKLGMNYYLIPTMQIEHLSSEGAYPYKPGCDSKEYWEFKKENCGLKANHDVMEKCRQKNWPFYSPF